MPVGGGGLKSYHGNTQVSGSRRRNTTGRAWRTVRTQPEEKEVSLSPPSGWPVNTYFKCDLYNKTLEVRGWRGAVRSWGGVGAEQKQPLGARFGPTATAPEKIAEWRPLFGCPRPPRTGCETLNPTLETCSRNPLLGKKPPQKVEPENYSMVCFSLLCVSGVTGLNWRSLVWCS